MPNYQDSKIYSIRSYQTDEVYIGSTTELLCRRFAGHNRKYKCYLNGKFNYVTSFKLLELGDAYIELVELFPCTSKIELTKREGELIRATENCINKRVEGRTRKEYRQANREKLLEQRKEYYTANKDTINAKRNIKFDCECGGKYTKNHKARHLRRKKHIEYTNSKK